MTGSRQPSVDEVSISKEKVLFVARQLSDVDGHDKWAADFKSKVEDHHKNDATSMKFFDAMANAQLKQLPEGSMKDGLNEVMSATSEDDFYTKKGFYEREVNSDSLAASVGSQDDDMDIDTDLQAAAAEEKPDSPDVTLGAAGRVNANYGSVNVSGLGAREPGEPVSSPYAEMPQVPVRPAEYGVLHPPSASSSSSSEYTPGPVPRTHQYAPVPPEGIATQEYGPANPEQPSGGEYGGVPSGVGVTSASPSEYGGIPSGIGVSTPSASDSAAPEYGRVPQGPPREMPASAAGNYAQMSPEMLEQARRRGEAERHSHYASVIDPRYKRSDSASASSSAPSSSAPSSSAPSSSAPANDDPASSDPGSPRPGR